MTWRAAWAAVNARTALAGKALWQALPEILTAGAFLAGWFLLTYGLAGLTTRGLVTSDTNQSDRRLQPLVIGALVLFVAAFVTALVLGEPWSA